MPVSRGRRKRLWTATRPFFWLGEDDLKEIIQQCPGVSLWIAFIYGASGVRSAAIVQRVSWVLDAFSVLLILGIGLTAYGWRTGLAAALLASLSPLLALYGTWPLADAPASWLVLGGVWMMLLAARRQNWKWALLAGLMIGASCWMRANALLLVL
jgi:4-amino-4-deoxy-L-arabinose transferase-like glycosyltransferase